MKHTILTRRRLTALAALLAPALSKAAVSVTAQPLSKPATSVTAQPRRRTITRVFRNAAAMTVPGTAPSSAPVSAYLYPSPILVSGLPRGRIRDINVTLIGLGHNFPADLEVLLVGPRGQTAVVMGNAGGIRPVTDVTLRLDDEAAVPLPQYPDTSDPPLTSGTYRPKNFSLAGIEFNTPAPPAGMNAALSVFDGTNPNGTWRLFVQNQFGVIRPVGFAGGWTLELTVQVPRTRRRKHKRPAGRRRRGGGNRSTV